MPREEHAASLLEILSSSSPLVASRGGGGGSNGDDCFQCAVTSSIPDGLSAGTTILFEVGCASVSTCHGKSRVE